MSQAKSNGQLLSILGVSFGVAVAVGNIIGSGILRAPSSIAHMLPDIKWIMALWLLGAVRSLLGVNIFAELATSVPKAGGLYLYAHRAFGDVAGLVVGWSAFLSNLAGVAAASISFAEFLPLLVPAAAAHKLSVALGMQLLLFTANFYGVRQGRALQETTSLIKALMLIGFAIAAVAIAEPHLHVASPPPETIGWMAVIGAFSLISGAYSGYEAPVFFSEESTSPGRDIPRALVFGVLITALIYIAVNGALLYSLGLAGTAATPLPFSTVLNRFGGTVPAVLFALGAMITVAGTANAIIMKSPRMLLAMARDGLLPSRLTSINRGGTPDMAMAMVAVGALALAASGSFNIVFGLIALLDTVGGVLSEAALFALRWREPDLARPFRAIGYPVLPALVLALDLTLMVLFAGSSLIGLEFALALAAAAVPFAIIARRARRRA